MGGLLSKLGVLLARPLAMFASLLLDILYSRVKIWWEEKQRKQKLLEARVNHENEKGPQNAQEKAASDLFDAARDKP